MVYHGLHLVFSSPRHLMISGGGIIIMEILYQMDFSLMGFVICCSILGFGMLQSLSCIFEATSLGRFRRGSLDSQPGSEGALQENIQMSPLPS
ncbi:hypothetical protein ZIOFF_027675 [Zingiber officinale]|uniref:Uncharacterized protein n=1 Tax=Zingiber officinale TaxID=94328 RepID=A0A8J5GLT4_ZINOF|nr:hypothetical protein ZIOFF_027675 [Zingiber officinale]